MPVFFSECHGVVAGFSCWKSIVLLSDPFSDHAMAPGVRGTCSMTPSLTSRSRPRRWGWQWVCGRVWGWRWGQCSGLGGGGPDMRLMLADVEGARRVKGEKVLF